MKHLVCLVLVFGVACGDDDVPTEDAGADAATSDVGADAPAIDAPVDACGCPAPGPSCFYAEPCACDSLVCGHDAAMPPIDGGPEDGGGVDACMPPPCAPPPDGCRYVTDDPCNECGDLVCECTEDEDCAPDGFCRAVDADVSSRECHGWAQERDRCGGFVLPHHEERCDPVLGCFSDPRIADAPGSCALPAEVRDLVESEDPFIGHFIAATGGVIEVLNRGCTRRACTEEMPCCNDCNGVQVLSVEGGSVPLLHPDGTPYTCTGNECEWTSCDTEPGPNFTVVGDYDGDGLRVTSIFGRGF